MKQYPNVCMSVSPQKVGFPSGTGCTPGCWTRRSPAYRTPIMSELTCPSLILRTHLCFGKHICAEIIPPTIIVDGFRRFLISRSPAFPACCREGYQKHPLINKSTLQDSSTAGTLKLASIVHKMLL